MLQDRNYDRDRVGLIDTGVYKKEFLSNGIPIITETTEGMRSVCIGIWINVGSRHESSDKNGISHFLEHMFFKGTKKRTARDIAVEIDSIGGELNAFTSREGTTFYVKILDEHIEKGIELLTDVFLHSTFPEEDIEKERRIIKEEIKMVEDTPHDYIHDLFSQTVWGEEGLGQPVLGRRETIKTFTREDLVRHIRKYYGTMDTIVACAGNFEQDTLIHSLEHKLGSLRRASEPERGPAPKFMSKVNIIPKDLSEVHICLGLEGLPQGSEERYSMYLLNTILGAGVSSRLFQEIREKRGLAYSIYSFISSYYDTGLWAVYAGTGRKRAREVINLISDELRGLSNTITSDELQRAKDQLKGNLILALESTSSRMTNIARQEIYYRRYFSPDEIMKAVDAVTLEKIKELSDRLLNKNPLTSSGQATSSGQVSYDSQRIPFALVVYGPVKETVYDL